MWTTNKTSAQTKQKCFRLKESDQRKVGRYENGGKGLNCMVVMKYLLGV